MRFLISGELDMGFPLLDAEKFGLATAITPTGKVRLDKARVEARLDNQVEMAFTTGNASFVILGGAHDLTTSARRFTDGGCEHIKVTTSHVRVMCDK